MIKMARIKDTNIWYPVQKSDDVNDNKFVISFDFLQQMFYDSYLEKINEHYYSSDLFEFNIPKELKGASEAADRLFLSISTSLRRIRRSALFKQLFRFRVIDDFGHVVYIQIRPFKDNYEEKPVEFLVSLVVGDNSKMTADMFMMKINIDNSKGASIIHGAQTAFFCSERMIDADNEVHDYNFDVSCYYAGPKLVCILERCLYLSLNYLDIPWNQWKNITHSNAELMLLRNIIQREHKDGSTHCVDAWGRDEKVVVPKTLTIPPISRASDTTTIPKIDFNNKEWKFVSGYCIRNNLLGNDAHVDLHKYLDKPRYGKELKIPISCTEVDEHGNENITSIPVVITYEIADDDSIVIFILETVDENTHVIATVASRDITNFNLFDNLLEMQKIIVYSNPSAVRSSLKELIGDSMLAGAGANGIGGIMRKALEVFIVIQDRPERSRMVKCTETKKVKVRQSNSKKKRVEEKSITWRVLKPFKEAKEYVERMTAERRDAEYTIEEWERQGHLRTYKSGKSVWIEPTTCHRRKPLSEKNKEITIKL